MSYWKKAKKVPTDWENKDAWRWNEFDSFSPYLTTIPEGFSREAQHCEGVWYRLVEKPFPPKPRR